MIRAENRLYMTRVVTKYMKEPDYKEKRLTIKRRREAVQSDLRNNDIHIWKTVTELWKK